MWQASAEQLNTLAELHTEIVKEFNPSCSGFVCDNAKLRDFISKNVSKETAREYNKAIGEIRSENTGDADNGMVMQKEELNSTEQTVSRVNGVVVAVIVIVVVIAAVVILKRRNKRKEE